MQLEGVIAATLWMGIHRNIFYSLILGIKEKGINYHMLL